MSVLRIGHWSNINSIQTFEISLHIHKRNVQFAGTQIIAPIFFEQANSERVFGGLELVLRAL
jgi:hypothetical protein